MSHVEPEYLQIGWPTSLPTSEKDTFVKNVLQEKVAAVLGFNVLYTI